jgi:hypothetical protein
VLLASVLGAGSALAASAPNRPSSGRIQLQATAGAGAIGKIVVTGAIGDWGTTRTMDQNGKTDPNGNLVAVKLTKGSFVIDSTKLSAKLANTRPAGNAATCSLYMNVSAPVTIMNGTGLYKGISGSATATISFGGVGARYASGKHKGECIENQNAQPLAQLGFVHGQGSVTFK